MLTQLVTYFISKLVENPDVVVISEITKDDKNIIEIRVAPQDLARVIGKEGRTFKALRSLVNAVDIQNHKDIVVEALS